jgi:curved DNA-binding protein CbpA
MRADSFDPYATLGVARTASQAEIKAAYLALVARYHPDKHQGNDLEDLAAEKMAQVNRAYELLSNPARRAAYDSAGTAGAPPFGVHTGGAMPRRRNRLMTIVGIALLLPILLRFGRLLVRALVALGRLALEGAGVVRGTPVVAVVVLLMFGALAFALLRRRKRKVRGKASPGSQDG